MRLPGRKPPARTAGRRRARPRTKSSKFITATFRPRKSRGRENQKRMAQLNDGDRKHLTGREVDGLLAVLGIPKDQVCAANDTDPSLSPCYIGDIP